VSIVALIEPVHGGWKGSYQNSTFVFCISMFLYYSFVPSNYAVISNPLVPPLAVLPSFDAAKLLDFYCSHLYLMPIMSCTLSIFAIGFVSTSSSEMFVALSQEAEGDEEDWDGEDQGNASVKVMCRLCFSGENEGSTKAAKMLPCKLCNKRYHRNCLKNWAEHRGNKFLLVLSPAHICISSDKFMFVLDLFHINSWVCPSCRSCEVCYLTLFHLSHSIYLSYLAPSLKHVKVS
jgi:hypothetical protein